MVVKVPVMLAWDDAYGGRDNGRGGDGGCDRNSSERYGSQGTGYGDQCAGHVGQSNRCGGCDEGRGGNGGEGEVRRRVSSKTCHAKRKLWTSSTTKRFRCPSDIAGRGTRTIRPIANRRLRYEYMLAFRRVYARVDNHVPKPIPSVPFCTRPAIQDSVGSMCMVCDDTHPSWWGRGSCRVFERGMLHACGRITRRL